MSTPTEPNRPGGYALPTGSLQAQRRAKRELEQADIHLLGDTAKPHEPSKGRLKAAHSARNPNTRVYVGDCRDVLAKLPERGEVDLIFADPPFNWDVPYESWRDGTWRRWEKVSWPLAAVSCGSAPGPSRRLPRICLTVKGHQMW